MIKRFGELAAGQRRLLSFVFARFTQALIECSTEPQSRCTGFELLNVKLRWGAESIYLTSKGILRTRRRRASSE
jgi:hypothetical protein